VVPDCVANAGALILGATWHLTGQRAAPERVLAIGATTREVLERAAAADLPPIELALQLAGERVERAGASA
ncbi:MAG: Glu/Leu/Phe/Val dehydrogenase, partial [Planctomycetes bacterium]|nr:Glu/Leu/Phe/Val dehydrogenase [Planctomycetota bacterium]